jgi:hypothetical protein
MMEDDHYKLEDFKLPDGTVVLERQIPSSIRSWRRQFVKVPWTWVERLNGASGQTYKVALYLLYLHWKGKGEPIKLANGRLRVDGVSRFSKWRALGDLERRGLIDIERRPRRSPLIRLLA